MAKTYVQLSDTVAGWRIATNDITNHLGDLALLTTTADSCAVFAINEVDSDLGARTSLGTTTKLNLVAAINEVNTLAGGNDSDVGTISSLASPMSRVSLVAAINERIVDVYDNAGNKLNT